VSVNFPTRVYDNSPDLVDWLAGEMKAHGVKPEVEAFDLSMIFQAVSKRGHGRPGGPECGPVPMQRKEAL
jgi:3-keto-5-aminohexanoate cleavage enzyme